jgi:hypothetical protein
MFLDMRSKGQEGILVLDEVTFEVFPKIYCDKPLVKSGFSSLYALLVWRKQRKVTCYYKSWDKLYNKIHEQVRNFDYLCCSIATGLSQWPRGLRHELSWPPQTLGSSVRIHLKARMSVCIYSVFVLSSVQIAALRRADPQSKESYLLCKRSRNWKKVAKA